MDVRVTADLNFRSGFAAIIGRPNVGKSSIMNYFVGEKVAIVSDKPQTTRTRILGVASGRMWQVVFVDTPGMHAPRTKLGEYMLRSAESAREGADAVLAVADARHIGDGDRAVMMTALATRCIKYLIINKIDVVSPDILSRRIAPLLEMGFDGVFTVSALRGDNMDKLMEMIVAAMPEGPKYFPDDMITDQPERVLCAEIIREKALVNLREEIPHGIGVEMLSIKELSSALTEIHANIYIERESHKPVIIGKKGSMLKLIGSQARVDIEALLGVKVMLRLWIKVRADWRNRQGDLRNLGYED
jgi:GTP-binding protein Era